MQNSLSEVEQKCEDKFGQCECYIEFSVGQTNFVPKESTSVKCRVQPKE